MKKILEKSGNFVSRKNESHVIQTQEACQQFFSINY